MNAATISALLAAGILARGTSGTWVRRVEETRSYWTRVDDLRRPPRNRGDVESYDFLLFDV